MFKLTVAIACTLGLVYNNPYKPDSMGTCLWHNYTCVEICPEWMVKVKTNCSYAYWPALRTCENPEFSFMGVVCGFERCECPFPTVLDTDTGHCYDVDNCPQKHD